MEEFQPFIPNTIGAIPVYENANGISLWFLIRDRSRPPIPITIILQNYQEEFIWRCAASIQSLKNTEMTESRASSIRWSAVIRARWTVTRPRIMNWFYFSILRLHLLALSGVGGWLHWTMSINGSCSIHACQIFATIWDSQLEIIIRILTNMPNWFSEILFWLSKFCLIVNTYYISHLLLLKLYLCIHYFLWV